MPGPRYVKDFDFPASAGFTGSRHDGPREVRFLARGGKAARQAKVGKVLGEFKAGELHSGSKTGPVVTNPKQAQAIALSEAGVQRKAGGGSVSRNLKSVAEAMASKPSKTWWGIFDSKTGELYSKHRQHSSALADFGTVSPEGQENFVIRKLTPKEQSLDVDDRSYSKDWPEEKAKGGKVAEAKAAQGALGADVAHQLQMQRTHGKRGVPVHSREPMFHRR